MTAFNATHTDWQRRKLTRSDLLQMLVEPEYKVDESKNTQNTPKKEKIFV